MDDPEELQPPVSFYRSFVDSYWNSILKKIFYWLGRFNILEQRFPTFFGAQHPNCVISVFGGTPGCVKIGLKSI